MKMLKTCPDVDVDVGPDDDCRYPDYGPGCLQYLQAVASWIEAVNEKQTKLQGMMKTSPFAAIWVSCSQHPNEIRMMIAKERGAEVDAA